MLENARFEASRRRKCLLRSLSGLEKLDGVQRAVKKKGDRRAGPEAALLEDAQLRASHARFHTSML